MLGAFVPDETRGLEPDNKKGCVMENEPQCCMEFRAQNQGGQQVDWTRVAFAQRLSMPTWPSSTQRGKAREKGAKLPRFGTQQTMNGWKIERL